MLILVTVNAIKHVFIRIYTHSLYDVIMTSLKSKIFGCRAEFDSVFHSEQHIQKLYVTYENAAMSAFFTLTDPTTAGV